MVMTVEEAYRILEVQHGASEAEVKTAYKKLALRTHPDKNPNDPDARQKFQRVSEAYKRIVEPESFKDEDDGGMEFEDFNEMFQSMFEDLLPMFMMMGGGGGPFNSRRMGGGAGMMFDMMAAEMLSDMMMGGGGMYEMDSDDEEEEYYDDDEEEDYDDGDGDDMAAFARAMAMNGMGMGGGMYYEPSSRASEHHSRGRSAPHSHNNHSHRHHHHHDDDFDSDEEAEMMEAMLFDQMMGGMGSMFGNHVIGGAFAAQHSRDDYNDDWLDSSTTRSKKNKAQSQQSAAASSKQKHKKDKKDKKKNKGKSPKKPAAAPSSTSTSAPATASSSLSADNSQGSDSDDMTESSCYLAVNDRVIVQNKHPGTVKYVGPVHYAAGTYVGVEMDQTSVGKNNGMIKGVKYFSCRKGEKSGLMVRVEDVRPLSLGDAAKLGK